MSNRVLFAAPHLKWKKGVSRIFLKLTLVYALLCVGGCAFQRRLIYFPTKLDPSSAQKAAEREGFLAWRNSSGQVIGWKFAASPISELVARNLLVPATAQVDGITADSKYFAIPAESADDASAFGARASSAPSFDRQIGSYPIVRFGGQGKVRLE